MTDILATTLSAPTSNQAGNPTDNFLMTVTTTETGHGGDETATVHRQMRIDGGSWVDIPTSGSELSTPNNADTWVGAGDYSSTITMEAAGIGKTIELRARTNGDASGEKLDPTSGWLTVTITSADTPRDVTGITAPVIITTPNAVISRGRQVDCSIEVVAVVTANANVNKGREVIGETELIVIGASGAGAGTTDYYIDASVTGPTDNDARWANDAAAFDGGIGSNSSASHNGSLTLNELRGSGYNGPSSGPAITQVRARIYGQAWEASNNTLHCEFLDGATPLGDAINATWVVNWGDYIILDAPAGGWTYAKLNSIEAVLYGTSDASGFSKAIAKIELEVTTGGSPEVTRGREVDCSTEVVSIVTADATVTTGEARVVEGVTAPVIITTPNAVVSRGRQVDGLTEAITVITANADVSRGRSVTGLTEVIAVITIGTEVTRGRVVAGATESIAVVTADAGVNRGREVEGATEIIAVATDPADVTRGREVDAETEVVTIVNAQATVTKDISRNVVGVTEAVVIVTPDAEITIGRDVAAVTEAISIITADADVSFPRIVVGVTEAISIVTPNAIVTRGREVAAITEVVSIATNLADVNRGRGVAGLTEAVIVATDPAVITIGRQVVGITEVVSVIANDATVDPGRGVVGATEIVAVVTAPAEVSRGREIVADTEIVTITTPLATVTKDISRNVVGLTAPIIVVTPDAVVSRGRTVAGATETVTLMPNTADVGLGRGVTGLTEAISVVTVPATVSKGREVTGITESVVIVTPDASITIGRDVAAVTELVSVVALDANVSRGRDVECATEVVSITGLAGNVDRGRFAEGVTEVITVVPSVADITRARSVQALTATVFIAANDGFITIQPPDNNVTSILVALVEKLGTLSLSPPLSIAWPGIPMKPPSTGMWLETRFFPNESDDLVWGNDSQLNTIGFFQVAVHWRPGEDSLIGASEVADAVITLFSKGTEVGPARIRKTPWQSPSVNNEGNSFIPVTIPYQGILVAAGDTDILVVGGSGTSDIINDLLTRLDTLSLSPVLSVAWPGVPMEPPSTGMWLEARFVPSESDDLVWDNNTQKNTTGMLLVSVYYRPGTNIGQNSQIAASEIADTIIALFPKGLGVGAVRISKSPWQGPSVDLEGKSYIPVMVPYSGIIAVVAA